jgi:hypothetical protein
MASITTGGSTAAGSYQTNSGMTAFEVGTARTITIGATTVNLALTSTCRFISIIAAGGTHCHYQIGVGAQTATASSHYLKTGERVILAVPVDANIAAIQGTGASTTLYISELLQ